MLFACMISSGSYPSCNHESRDIATLRAHTQYFTRRARKLQRADQKRKRAENTLHTCCVTNCRITRGGSSIVPYSMLCPLGMVINILGVTTTTCRYFVRNFTPACPPPSALTRYNESAHMRHPNISTLAHAHHTHTFVGTGPLLLACSASSCSCIIFSRSCIFLISPRWLFLAACTSAMLSSSFRFASSSSRSRRMMLAVWRS